MQRLRRYVLGVGLCLVGHTAWAVEPLRFGALSSWTMPYGRIENDQLTGGILFDLAQALQKSLSMPVSMVVLPRKRIDGAALAGDIDIRCYLTPKWTDIPEQFSWSGRLFEISEVLFGGEGVAQPAELRDLPAKAAISTVLGYAYPLLQARFADASLRREDTIDQEKVLLKISIGRTPYGVSDALALQWYQHNTAKHHLAPWRLPISHNDFQCGVPKKGKVAAAKILAALEELKRSGQIEDILRNYR